MRIVFGFLFLVCGLFANAQMVVNAFDAFPSGGFVDFSDFTSLYALKNHVGTGAVARIRRGSDSAQADFTGTEIEDGTLETWLGVTNGFVEKLYDQIGTNDMVNGSGNHQIALSTGVLRYDDGGNVTVFGANGYFESTNIFSGAGNRTVICVVDYNGTQDIFDLDYAGGTGAQFRLRNQGIRCSGPTYVNASPLSDFDLLECFTDGDVIQTDVSFYANGNFLARDSGTDGSFNTGTGNSRIIMNSPRTVTFIAVGAGNYESSRAEIESYLNTIYTIY
jgi:hypothetical protein